MERIVYKKQTFFINPERIEIVNSLIEEISKTKRQFLKNGRVAIDKNSLVYFNHYNGKRIDMLQSPEKISRVFSSGGTLQSLVFEEFRDYILGNRVLFTETGLGSSYWGIPWDEIDALRVFAKELGYFA